MKLITKIKANNHKGILLNKNLDKNQREGIDIKKEVCQEIGLKEEIMVIEQNQGQNPNSSRVKAQVQVQIQVQAPGQAQNNITKKDKGE